MPPASDEYTYVRAVILSDSTVQRELARREFLGHSARMVKTPAGNRLLLVEVESLTPPPPYLRDRIKSRQRKGQTFYVYEIAVTESKVQGRPIMLFSAPLRTVIRDLRRPTFRYAKLDLPRICDEQFGMGSDPAIVIARVHLRVNGEDNRISSATLYGPDLLRSEFLRKILESESIDISEPPFQKLAAAGGSAPIQVNSCRLVLDEGIRKFGLNVDKFGNFSFRYAGAETADAIVRVLQYAASLGGIINADTDPTSRSDAALDAVTQ